MFNNNAVTSSWANPQQNQQQQPQGGLFGGGGTFGSGSAGAFGQPAQPAAATNAFGGANPMFGAQANTTGNSAFGAFGQPNNNNANSNPLVKPATGFGAFSGGGQSTFGGGSTGGSVFGQNNAAAGPSSGIFGQPANNANTSTTNAFGGGASTSLFGQKSAFGAPAAPAGDVVPPPVTSGSSNPPYSVYTEKDSANSNLTLQYQAISCMPAYRGTSFEEIRLQDYTQGRKVAGNTSSFGGGSSLFGQTQQPQQQQSTGLFGAPQQITGAFGNPAPASTTPAFGAFGQPQQNPQQQPTAFGAFGQQNQNQAQPQTSIFGAAAQPQQQQQQGTSGFGAFSNPNAPKPGVFGAPAATTSAFGGGGAFGATQPAQQQQQPSIFGAAAQPAATTGFGAFGNPANNAAKPSIFGTPATNQQATPGIFGNTQGQQTQPATGIFGNAAGGGGGVFGQAQQGQAGQQQPQTSIFGNPAPAQQQQQPAGTGIFGGGGGLFGSTNNNNNANQQTQPQQPANNLGLFGAPKPATATPGIFGSSFGQSNNNTGAAAPQTSIFGQPLNQSTNNNNQAAPGSSIFGQQRPTAPGLGGIGANASNGPGGSIFGTSFGGNNAMMNGSTNNNPMNGSINGQQQQQGSLTASIAQPIANNLPIFAMLPEGPRAVSLEQQAKKKPGFFVDVPTRSPVPRVGLGYTPASSRLRGFGSSTNVNSNSLIGGGGNGGGNPFSSSMSFSSGVPNALSLDSSSSSHPHDAFFGGRSSSPALGSGARGSVKKLILGKKVDSADLFVKTTSGSVSPGMPAKVMFSPALSVAAREKEAAKNNAAALTNTNAIAAIGQAESPTPASRTQQRTPNRFTAKANALDDTTDQPPADLKEGDYWMSPDLATVKKAGYELLSAYPNVKVGRVGYGQIEFLEPVDLTGIGKLSSLLGTVIRFDDKECSVYPDDVDLGKPEPGEGLNVRARLELVRCWAVDKATREPIRDEKHPSAVRHLKRLKGMKGTKFVAFEPKEGRWTFEVDHF